ncbi:Lipocalin-like domain-containing protein [Parachaetomium inaequale]|uniref:Lipocalin-like domain-containing protein n=1 Tax=Parachaetomium inaequale TaxID=2588326 RepID=A0AAN6P722_9PEZI|nr:Lipocalin-like domain-containing protein [Parachaetomium inaequale]
MVNIAGVWNLISFNYLLNGTSILQPNGPHPLGKITIMPEGYLSVQITTPEAAVPIPGGVKWGDASDAEIAAIARPYVAYSGKYVTSYVGDQLVLTTTVDVALDPSWMTRPQRRNATLFKENGTDYMILRPVGTIPMTLPGNITGDIVSELIWEKEIAICRKRSVPTA